MSCFGLPQLWMGLSFGLPQLRTVFALRKENPLTSDPLVFSRRTLFGSASEAFMISSSAVADGFSICDFRFSPDPSDFFNCFWVLSRNRLSCHFFPVAKIFKLSSPDLKPSDVRSLNCYPICITRTEGLALWSSTIAEECSLSSSDSKTFRRPILWFFFLLCVSP